MKLPSKQSNANWRSNQSTPALICEYTASFKTPQSAESPCWLLILKRMQNCSQIKWEICYPEVQVLLKTWHHAATLVQMNRISCIPCTSRAWCNIPQFHCSAVYHNTTQLFQMQITSKSLQQLQIKKHLSHSWISLLKLIHPQNSGVCKSHSSSSSVLNSTMPWLDYYKYQFMLCTLSLLIHITNTAVPL